MEKKIKEFQENDNCDDKFDPLGYGFEKEYELAESYVGKPAPEEPLPKDRNQLLDKVKELGGYVEDGAIWFDKNVSPVVVTTLTVIATILGLVFGGFKSPSPY